MKFLLTLLMSLYIVNAHAADKKCHLDLITLPNKHEIIGCQQKPDGVAHFKSYDTSRNIINRRKAGSYTQIQFKYTGDWLVTPSRVQLVPFYYEQIRKYDGKLLFQDEHRASYKYYHNNRTFWLELSFIGNGIHVLKRIAQDGILKEPEHSVAQIKSRLKKYGKVIFYDIGLSLDKRGDLSTNTSFQELAKFLNANPTEKFYLVCHRQDAPAAYIVSQSACINIAEHVLSWSEIADRNIHSISVGAASPIVNPKAHNARQKNTRLELVYRLGD